MEDISAFKQAKREKREKKKMEQEYQKQQMAKNAMKHGSIKGRDTSTNKKGKGGDERMTAESLEADLNIPQSLKEIIDDSDEDILLRFNDPDELMELISSLEEQNLFLIKRCQDSE